MTLLRPCATTNCERHTRPGFKFCDDCTAVVLRTSRPPELPVKFVPEWRKRLTGRDETAWVKAA